MWQPTLAALFAFWPAPLGTGYLFLKRWGRFLVAFLGLQMVGLSVVRMTFGSDAGLYFAAAIYVAVIADTWRLARRRYNELKATVR